MLENKTQSESTDQERDQGETPASLAEKSLPFLVMLLVLILDYVSKLFIEIWLPLYTSWAPIESLAGVFQITHVSNTGAAFGLVPSGSIVFMVVAVVVTIVIVVYNHRLSANHQMYRVALGLQLGGALGNFISRVRIGHVTDFLDFGPWPVFNLADLSIVTGTILLGYLMLREESSRGEPKTTADLDESDQDQDPAEDREMLWNE